MFLAHEMTLLGFGVNRQSQVGILQQFLKDTRDMYLLLHIENRMKHLVRFDTSFLESNDLIIKQHETEI